MNRDPLPPEERAPLPEAAPVDHAAPTRPRWTVPDPTGPNVDHLSVYDPRRAGLPPASPEPPPEGMAGDRRNPAPAWGGTPTGHRSHAPPYRVPFVVEAMHADGNTGFRRAKPRYFARMVDAEAYYRDAVATAVGAWIVTPYGIERGFSEYCEWIRYQALAIAREAEAAATASTPEARARARARLSTLHGLTLETEFRVLHPGEDYPGLAPDPFRERPATSPEGPLW